MKFIIDTQLPPRLSHYLQTKGYDAIHTTDFEKGHLLGDDKIVLIAKKEERTVITKDSDFLDNYVLKGAPPKILLIEFGNIGNNDLIDMFKLFFDKVLDVFNEGNNLVLFRRNEIIGY